MIEHPGVFTNHRWKNGSGAFFKSYNPATLQPVWQGRACQAQEVEEAIQNAKQAFKEWSSYTIDERSQYLNRFADFLQRQQKEIAQVISKETGKPLWESNNEVMSMVGKVGLSLEAYGSRCAGMIRDQATGRSITRHRPHGVVAVFGPFNFPGHLPQGHIIPALLAGNTIVFKPSESTPLVAEEIVKIWEKTGLPAGVINLAQGGHDTGQALIGHPDLNGLFFTGSYPTGKWLAEFFAAQPQKILALEMGGNNPLVVSQINDPQAAAYLTIQSAYLSAGQRCTCARRLIVPKGKKGDHFIDVLVEMARSIHVGPYTDIPEPYMGPVINEKQAKKILEAQTRLLAAGGRALLETKQLYPGTGFLSPGLIDVTAVQDRPDEEIFGPFLQTIRVSTFEEAIAEANHTKYGLAAGLISDQQEEYNLFYKSIRAGIVNWNTPLTGASGAAPFGGIGCSGNHRPSAYYAADYCSYPVASLESNQIKMPTHLPPGFKLKT